MPLAGSKYPPPDVHVLRSSSEQQLPQPLGVVPDGHVPKKVGWMLQLVFVDSLEIVKFSPEMSNPSEALRGSQARLTSVAL